MAAIPSLYPIQYAKLTVAMKQDISPLPYSDSKPVGAADFYFAINATFRFILARFGLDGLRRYWTDLGASYFSPVSDRWKSKGLIGIEEYWLSFFKAETGSEVEVRRTDAMVTVIDLKERYSRHGRILGPYSERRGSWIPYDVDRERLSY